MGCHHTLIRNGTRNGLYVGHGTTYWTYNRTGNDTQQKTIMHRVTLESDFEIYTIYTSHVSWFITSVSLHLWFCEICHGIRQAARAHTYMTNRLNDEQDSGSSWLKSAKCFQRKLKWLGEAMTWNCDKTDLTALNAEQNVSFCEISDLIGKAMQLLSARRRTRFYIDVFVA